MSTFYHTNGNNNLNQSDLQKLSDSWITPELAEQAGLFRVDKYEGAELVGRNGSGDYSGIVFPYYWPGETRPREYRLRLDNPDYEYRADGTRKEKNKYLSPPGGSNRLYIPPGTPPSLLTDTSTTILITEGEKKALALYRLGIENGRRWLVIGLSGVWNWRGTVGKEEGPNGERRDVKGPIADLDRVQWRREQVMIAFDSNVHSNASVKAARRELAHELTNRGAKVSYVSIPEDAGINGVDDLLAIWKPKRVLELLDLAQPSEGELVRFNKTDAGNAEVFAYLYGDLVRYDHSRGRWLLWNEHWWGKDEDNQLHRLAIDAARQRFKQSINIVDLDERKRMAVWAIASESRSKIEATLALAKAMRPIADVGTGWDCEPWLLGVVNGIIDLRTGDLRPSEQRDRITLHTSVAYDPGKQCPLWLAFLDRIMAGNDRLVRFLQRAVGYSLTGKTGEKTLFFLYGHLGDNGKSTFIETITKLLGNYALEKFPLKALAAGDDRPEGATPSLAELPGKRFVSASEVNSGIRLNEALVKDLTGGIDTISVRPLYEKPFRFRPCSKWWLYGNFKPQIRDSSNAMWNRVKMIPFSVSIPKNEQDQDLGDKLCAELPGILNWAIRGCLEWQQNGLGEPEEVKQATAAYRAEMDVLGAFLDECCVLDSHTQVAASDLYAAYTTWCEQTGEHSMTQTSLGTQLTNRGFTRQRRAGGRHWWVGIGLRQEEKAYD